jgi:predicted RNase H-like nuclease
MSWRASFSPPSGEGVGRLSTGRAELRVSMAGSLPLMPSVLAIDPAWTSSARSGVALLDKGKGGWTCVALAPSYDDFIALASGKTVSWSKALPGSVPSPSALLSAAKTLLGGREVDLVVADIPLATVPIIGRRVADDAIARAFGAMGIGTHTPSTTRPGPLSPLLVSGFGQSGHVLATAGHAVGLPQWLIEVYPHPALVKLLGRTFRVPYKVGKSSNYWKKTPLATRRANLLAEWTAILAALAKEIVGIPLTPQALALTKAHEDGLDALICGWVGTRYFDGAAKAYGDVTAAIWCPP